MRRTSEVSDRALEGPPDRPKLRVEYVAIGDLAPYVRNARKHSRKQISQISASIREFGFNNPILIAPDDTLIAGHARLEAARHLGMHQVPAVRLEHLSDVQRRAYILAENRLAELSDWSIELLEQEMQDLAELKLDFPLEIIGFEGAQLEQLTDPQSSKRDDKADQTPEAQGPAVTRLGDVWLMGEHRLFCGDAMDLQSCATLMAHERARMVFTDPPFNLKIDGHVGGLGRAQRREFVQGSGELSKPAFAAFLQQALTNAASVCCDGAIAYVVMDWRHLTELAAAAEHAFSEQKQLIAWVKSSGGMGTFYRSRHEMIGVYKVGAAPHVNTFGLGEKGRYRTNVWEYPGVNTFGPGRDEALDMHPTVKPVALVADAIRDVSHRGDLVLDMFAGSGTTIIAAQKTRRRARVLELDPLYCDVICRRWRSYSGEEASLEATGASFSALEQARAAE